MTLRVFGLKTGPFPLGSLSLSLYPHPVRRQATLPLRSQPSHCRQACWGRPTIKSSLHWRFRCRPNLDRVRRHASPGTHSGPSTQLVARHARGLCLGRAMGAPTRGGRSLSRFRSRTHRRVPAAQTAGCVQPHVDRQAYTLTVNDFKLLLVTPSKLFAKSGDTMTVTAAVTNFGPAAVANVAAAQLQLNSNGSTASVSCGPATPVSVTLAAGASQNFAYVCSGFSGNGSVAFSTQASATLNGGPSFQCSSVWSAPVVIDNVQPTFSPAVILSGGQPYTPGPGNWTSQNVTVDLRMYRQLRDCPAASESSDFEHRRGEPIRLGYLCGQCRQ